MSPPRCDSSSHISPESSLCTCCLPTICGQLVTSRAFTCHGQTVLLRGLPCGSRSLFTGLGDMSTPHGCLMRPEAADTSLLCYVARNPVGLCCYHPHCTGEGTICKRWLGGDVTMATHSNPLLTSNASLGNAQRRLLYEQWPWRVP